MKQFTAAFGNATINPASTDQQMFDEITTFSDMVYNEIATARTICKRLYLYFVHSNIDSEIENDIINPLATQLYNDNYNIENTMKLLLKSEHFYDQDDSVNNDEIIGGMIKSPLQQVSEIINFFNIDLPDPDSMTEEYYEEFFNKFITKSHSIACGMEFLNPDSVAGYPAYYQEPGYDKLWFTSSTIIARYRLFESFLTGKNEIKGINRNIEVILDIVDFVKNSPVFSDPSKSGELVDDLISYLLPETPDMDRRNYYLNDVFLIGNLPSYWTTEWTNYMGSGDTSVVKPRLEALAKAIMNSPELQLF